MARRGRHRAPRGPEGHFRFIAGRQVRMKRAVIVGPDPCGCPPDPMGFDCPHVEARAR
ncbi:hypothetical protein I5G61_gp81 [Mycobacterium phage Quesadilla]|uniref:Uncharacterized protein n=1 Tax=Mycobacterium phage Quesadilla TaxID=2664226 RepID=A0A5Q2WF65_9CAUD|nr:hypothetical protein I5G61_gp81 [Mycobacterium phage Quesadilla]QGH75329.1 hypothetical protein SEA_QUESADILLA_81 [Mycobacterium phage Quesadilla]